MCPPPECHNFQAHRRGVPVFVVTPEGMQDSVMPVEASVRL